MARESVTSSQAPAAIGPYSQAVWCGNLLYCSGQTPINPSNGKLLEGGIAQQTHQAFENLRQVLAAAGLGMDQVIKCNVYLVDMADFSGMNTEYQAQFTAPYPARTTVAVHQLPLGARVEIELIARK